MMARRGEERGGGGGKQQGGNNKGATTARSQPYLPQATTQAAASMQLLGRSLGGGEGEFTPLHALIIVGL